MENIDKGYKSSRKSLVGFKKTMKLMLVYSYALSKSNGYIWFGYKATKFLVQQAQC